MVNQATVAAFVALSLAIQLANGVALEVGQRGPGEPDELPQKLFQPPCAPLINSLPAH